MPRTRSPHAWLRLYWFKAYDLSRDTTYEFVMAARSKSEVARNLSITPWSGLAIKLFKFPDCDQATLELQKRILESPGTIWKRTPKGTWRRHDGWTDSA